MNLKILALLTGVCALSFCLIGCGGGAAEKSSSAASSSSSSAASSSTTASNPFVDCKDMAEAQKIVGFSMECPKELGGNPLSGIRAAKSLSMIEVLYSTDMVDIRARKALASKNDADISGNNNTYPDSAVVESASGKVKAETRGAHGNYYVACWTEGDYVYSLTHEAGFSRDELVVALDQIH